MEKRILKFEGIDSFNRPIFKDENNNRFGNMNILFSGHVTGKDVLEKIDETKIYYFGTTFDCEPEGLKIAADKIKLEI